MSFSDFESECSIVFINSVCECHLIETVRKSNFNLQLIYEIMLNSFEFVKVTYNANNPLQLIYHWILLQC